MTAENAILRASINTAMAYFESVGWTHNQSAGITANLEAESGVDPSRKQMGGGPGYGIAQWEGPRQASFKAWSGRDIHYSTLLDQLRFVHHELTTTEKGAGDALRLTQTAGDAGATVCRLYERPADTDGQAVYRCKLAEQIAAQTLFANVQAGSESTA